MNIRKSMALALAAAILGTCMIGCGAGEEIVPTEAEKELVAVTPVQTEAPQPEAAQTEPAQTEAPQTEPTLPEAEIVKIAAGPFHAVLLYDDGRVSASGENRSGECDVDHWENIVDVVAGSDFTAGITADGTAIFAGSGDYPQWRNVRKIAASDYSMAALMANGTVEAWDSEANQQVSAWRDVVDIAVGMDLYLGLKADGTAVAAVKNDYYPCDVSGWSDIVSIGAGLDHVLGLRSDGTAVAAGLGYMGECDVTGWSDIVRIGAAPGYSVGLRSDGTAVAAGIEYIYKDLAYETDIQDFALSAYNMLVLHTDGTTSTCGPNPQERPETYWMDVRLMAVGYDYSIAVTNDGRILTSPEEEAHPAVAKWQTK